MPSKKSNIKQSFGRSHSTYQKAAIVQQQLAHQLVEELVLINNSFDIVLELGAGTGILTKELLGRTKIEHLFCNDLTDSREFLRDFSTFLLGDAEKIAYPRNLDLIISNAVIQWFEALPQFFQKVKNHLKREGILAFTTFGPNNFQEIRETTNSGLDYKNLGELLELLSEDFEILFQKDEFIILEFENPRALLQHLKATGVNGLEKKVWTKSTYQAFCQNYPKLNNKTLLTYHPITIIAQRKKIRPITSHQF